MSKESKEKKYPIRFLISEKKHKEIKQKAKEIDVSIGQYIKMKVFGEQNG